MYAHVEAGADFDAADGPVELTVNVWYDSTATTCSSGRPHRARTAPSTLSTS